MIWGWCCGLDSINSSIPAGATALLGFNEPNHAEESNISPQQAATLWPQFEQAKQQRGGKLRLGSPAPAPCGASCNGPSNPIDWLTAFYAACNQMYGRDCETDFIATHLYTCNAQYLQWFLNDIATRFKRPVWLTETACPNNGGALGNQISYMRAALSAMDAMPSVERYAWFAPHADAFAWLGGGQAGSPSLLTSSSPPQLTTLGRIYMGLASDRPAEGLSDDAAAAMRAPLPALSTTGSWSEACAKCTGGAAALASLAQGEQPAFRQHCSDCGFGQSGAFWSRAAGERYIRKIDL
ncbi:hypothetical protein WJX81_004538 [Elliptochloris bilobata]|uniref:Asl1-like glycosyl hydrolase catalytic domain-containing protein n=1 Tax=Elliptochloris bilobata TaxID=381761 RepID=A0AAW1SD22_9CHLO